MLRKTNQHLALVLLSAIELSGCSSSSGDIDPRLGAFEERLVKVESTLSIDEHAEVPLPKLNAGEMLVVMNGNYLGRLCDESALTPKAAKVLKDFNMSSVGAALFLVKGDDVQSKALSLAGGGAIVFQQRREDYACPFVATEKSHSVQAVCGKPTTQEAAKGRRCSLLLTGIH